MFDRENDLYFLNEGIHDIYKLPSQKNNFDISCRLGCDFLFFEIYEVIALFLFNL